MKSEMIFSGFIEWLSRAKSINGDFKIARSLANSLVADEKERRIKKVERWLVCEREEVKKLRETK